MYRYINGEHYSTNTGTFIDDKESDNHEECRGVGYWYEALFVNKNGAYFLQTYGTQVEPLTKEYLDNTTSIMRSKIQPLTNDEAKRWLQGVSER